MGAFTKEIAVIAFRKTWHMPYHDKEEAVNQEMSNVVKAVGGSYSNLFRDSFLWHTPVHDERSWEHDRGRIDPIPDKLFVVAVSISNSFYIAVVIAGGLDREVEECSNLNDPQIAQFVVVPKAREVGKGHGPVLDEVETEVEHEGDGDG